MNINEILKSDYDLCCKELKKATKKIEKQEIKIARLNNIINELEKMLEEDYKNNQDTTDYPCVYLDKLKELKGDDK